MDSKVNTIKSTYIVVDDDRYEEFRSLAKALKIARESVEAGEDSWVPAERLLVGELVAEIHIKRIYKVIHEVILKDS